MADQARGHSDQTEELDRAAAVSQAGQEQTAEGAKKPKASTGPTSVANGACQAE